MSYFIFLLLLKCHIQFREFLAWNNVKYESKNKEKTFRIKKNVKLNLYFFKHRLLVSLAVWEKKYIGFMAVLVL